MNKNYSAVIIIHMESLNEEIFWGDMGNYPNLQMLLKEGVYCDRFYSTATSTIMAMTDLVYGDRTACEKSVDLEHFLLDTEKTSLFEELAERQYDTKAVFYPILSETDTLNIGKIFGEQTQIVQRQSYQDFLAILSDLICSDTPSALYVDDRSGLLTQPGMERSPIFVQSCKNRYRHMDDTIGYVVEQLQKAGKFQDTLMVLFGDHGDDLYSEGFHNGFTHAIEPYYSLIKTPLLLKNVDIGQTGAGHLMDMTDIRGLVLTQLDGNIRCEEKEYVIARNLFLRQKSKSLNKSVCVTDGAYLLLASKKGMALYCTLYPNYRHFNLLNLFRLSADGKLIYRKWTSKIKTEHYRFLMDAYQEDFANVFARLYEKMKEELIRMGQAAEGKETYLHWLRKIHAASDIQRQMKGLRIRKTCYWIKDNLIGRKK